MDELLNNADNPELNGKASANRSEMNDTASADKPEPAGSVSSDKSGQTGKMPSDSGKAADNTASSKSRASAKPSGKSGRMPTPRTSRAKADYVNWKLDCPADLRSFLVYMETIKGRSSRTVSAYYVDLRLFCRYLKMTHGLAENIPFDEIQIEDLPRSLIASVTLSEVLEFFSFLMNERSNAASTRARKVSALHSFYKYLEMNSIVKDNPVKNLQLPAVPKTLPKHLTLEESRSLLNVSGQTSASRRDHCIFTLFLNCGMRLSELVGINLSDVQNDRIQITGKGNKQRIAYLNEACQQALSEYLPERRAIPDARDSQALFLSRNKTRITPRGVETVLQKYLQMLGLTDKGYTVHKLRHTAATLMYQYGKVDIRVLQMILGHENLGTTQIYTHVSNQQMEDAVKSSPLAKAEKNE